MNLKVAKGYLRLALRHLIRSGKVVRRYPAEMQGKRYLRYLINTSQSDLIIDERSGWTRFNFQNMPRLQGDCAKLNTLVKLQTLAVKCLDEAESRRSNDGVPYNLMLSSDLIEHPDILEFALADEFLLPVSIYLGQVPRLTNIALTWSPKNQEITGSRKFHYDHRDIRQVKLFINLHDIGDDGGPICFLPADECSKFNSKIGYNQLNNDDDIVYSACNKESLVKNTGPAGSGILVDTARCLHYGSRGSKNDRLMLMVSFVRSNCVLPGKISRVLDPLRHKLAHELFENNPVKKYALMIQAK